MKKIGHIYLIVALPLAACNNVNQQQEVGASLLSNTKNEASCVFLTKDEKNNPVISWIETDSKGIKFFYLANWEAPLQKFGTAVSVPIEQNTSIHEEGMPKIAFKSNGTIVATFETSTPSSKSKYGLSDIQYVFSFDKGKTWTRHQSIQSGNGSVGSHSFGNIIRLDDGEIGISWLGSSADNATGGRPVMFAKTNGKNGFGKAVLLESQGCQCCRTALSSNEKGNVSVVFRNLLLGSIRDISVCSSTDNGQTFKKSIPFSNDQWVIDGCPHNGPSIVSRDDKTYVSWYTGAKQNGVFYAVLDKQNNVLTKRQLDPKGQFAQLGLMPNGTRMVAYNSAYRERDSSYSKIMVNRIEDDQFYEKEITLPKAQASYPVLQPFTDKKIIIAWRDNDKIYYSELHTDMIKDEVKKEVKNSFTFNGIDPKAKLYRLSEAMCGMKIN